MVTSASALIISSKMFTQDLGIMYFCEKFSENENYLLFFLTHVHLWFVLSKVTSCAWVPDSCQLFTGSKCGVITAYTNRLSSSTVGLGALARGVDLYVTEESLDDVRHPCVGLT